MTTVAIFGATGATGRAAVRIALGGHHDVIAAARDPSVVPAAHGLDVRRCDVLDEAAVDAVIASADAVILCLGTKPGEKRPVLTVGTQNVIAAMRRHGLSRLVVQGSLPLDRDRRGVSFGARLIYDALGMMAGPIVADKEGQRVVVEASELDWLLVRPVLLTNAPPRGQWNVTEAARVGAFDRVARADVAAFMVGETIKPTLSGRAVAFLPPARRGGA